MSMRRTGYLLTCIMLLLAACGSQPSLESTAEPVTQSPPSPTAEQPTATPLAPTPEPATNTPLPAGEPAAEATTEAPPPLADYSGLPLPADRGALFSASGVCSVCHTSMVDQAGIDVSTDTFWRASMMANSARDPYWQASVRSETLAHPELQAAIEDKCATCHTTMAHRTVAAAAGTGQLLDDGFLDAEHALHGLAVDGVSCTVCHQIQDEDLGESDSYSGGFVIDTGLPAGERESFGPHPVPRGMAMQMQQASGFIPIESLHVEQAELCATCHTLYTPFVDAEGQIAGEFPEQTPYLEWLASSFGGSLTCQGCHMPQAEGRVKISITGGPPISPFHQHIFVGGNAYMLKILQAFGDEMAVTASSAQFQDKQEQVAAQLSGRTASVRLEEVNLDGATLRVEVAMASMVGHKLPTGFPSRRVWLHLTVQDGSGQVVFESGAANPDGSIVGNDNDADPATYEPHYLVIDSPDQVQIYEAILGDTEGNVTTTLLKGAGYLKDNRLLPAGFDKGTVQDDIAVHGAALEDEDYAGGGDRIQYLIDLEDAQAPFTVMAELLYQSIGYRWADNLRHYDAPEPADFLSYYEQVPNQPIVIASDTAEVRE